MLALVVVVVGREVPEILLSHPLPLIPVVVVVLAVVGVVAVAVVGAVLVRADCGAAIGCFRRCAVRKGRS